MTQSVVSRTAPAPLARRLLAGALLALLLAATAPLSALADEVLRRGNGVDPETLDPQRATGIQAGHILYDLCEGLLAHDGKGGFIPGVAERWEVDADRLTYRFTLRPTARWSDGSPVAAEDFVAAWRRLLAPETGAFYADYLHPLRNAREILAGRMPPESLGVSAPRPDLLEVTLEGPLPHFLKMLAHHTTCPVHRASLARHGAEFARVGTMVSNGAYRLVEAVPQSHVRLEANPFFHDAASVAIKAVEFVATENLEAELRRFRAGDLHVTFDIPVSQMDWLRGNLADSIRLAPQNGVYFYVVNLEREPWRSEPRLVQALSLAIDRAAITEKILQQGQEPAHSFVPPTMPGHRPATPDHAAWTQAQREERARQLLAEAGYGPGGKALDLEIFYNTSENHRRIAIAIAAMLKRVLGLSVTLTNQEWKVFLDRRSRGDFDSLARHGFTADYPDPSSLLNNLASWAGPANPSKYASPAYDALIRRVDRLEGEARAAVFQEAEALVLAEGGVIPLYFYVSRHLVSPRIDGWTDNPLDIHPTRFIRFRD